MSQMTTIVAVLARFLVAANAAIQAFVPDLRLVVGVGFIAVAVLSS